MQRVLGEDHQSLEVGWWHLEGVICQVLFHAGWQEYHIQEGLAATNHHHQAQVRVTNIIAEFHMGMPVLDLKALHQVAMESQVTLQAYAKHLEALLVDQAFQPWYP